jgi:hypothetical protein
MLVDEDHPGSFIDYDPGEYQGELRRECRIILSTNHRAKTYQVCCPELFEDLPSGIIVKFEYTAGPTLTRLVDY